MNESKRFLEFAESLKLVRKTRIEDFIEDKTVDDIYVDLLPNDGIINKLNLPRTTILEGRKGTGKSTIFRKSQKDLVKNKKCISIYIDVNALFTNSTPTLPEEISSFEIEEINKYLIYTNLIKEIILETRNRLSDFVEKSILKKILGFEPDKIETIRIELQLIEDSISDVIKKIDSSLVKKFKNISEESTSSNIKGQLNISEKPGVNIGGQRNKTGSHKKEFESTLVSYLDIKTCLIENLLRIKNVLEIEHLYIFLDDFSEIDEEAQKVFVDWFIAPLNNLSDDFVKFKIAVYPHRFHWGKIDASKVNTISLDFFDAFYTHEKKTDISKMETLALNYTERLLEKRLNLFFPDNNWDKFFDIPESELFDILFSVSFNNPRKIGYILSFCYESCLIHDLKISREAIENAAQRYYSEIIEKTFLANQHVTKPFSDKVSNDHQYQLLYKIVQRQIKNSSKKYKNTVRGKPSNHFLVSETLVNLLDNLELNGFLSMYNMVREDEKVSVVYALDYGLCKKNNLKFTRASNEKLIKYFQQPRFDLNVLVYEYFNNTQLIVCPNNHQFPYSELETLKKFNMTCPECLENDIKSTCQITVSSSDVKSRLKDFQEEYFKLTLDEYLTLDYLETIKKTVSIKKISSALDKSEKTIKVLLEKLEKKEWVLQDLEVSRQLRKDYYFITEKGSFVPITINKLIRQKTKETFGDSHE